MGRAQVERSAPQPRTPPLPAWLDDGGERPRRALKLRRQAINRARRRRGMRPLPDIEPGSCSTCNGWGVLGAGGARCSVCRGVG